MNPETPSRPVPEKATAKRQWMLLAGLLVAGLLLVYWLESRPNRAAASTGNNNATPALYQEYRTYPMMGTIVEVNLYGEKTAALRAADAVYGQFLEIEKLANVYNPQSELSLLNRTAADRPFVCSPQLWDLLQESRRAWTISHGAFDITVKPLMDLWGFYRKRGEQVPSREEVAAVMKKVGLSKVRFDDAARSVRFTVPGMSFDLGGIAKGYAVGLAADAVKKCGIRRGIINLGGNMYCFPDPPPDKPDYTIGIRNPLDRNAVCGSIHVRDIALATSGNYERYVVINGQHFGHHMNPATGLPWDGTLSATIVTRRAVDSDLLSTSIFIGGAKLAAEIVKEIPGTSILIIRRKPGAPIEVLRFGPLDWGPIEL